MKNLNNKRIAILATDGFEESELLEPLKAIKEAGGEAHVISPHGGTIRAWKGKDWGKEVKVDKTLNEVTSSDYDGLVLPGGVINPDQLRRDQKAIAFIKDFFGEKKQKPVAAICHGPMTLINAGVIKGRTMTSYDSIKVDLQNAGASWVDKEVVCDQGLVTSRTPEDLKAFNNKMIEEFSEGRHKIPA